MERRNTGQSVLPSWAPEARSPIDVQVDQLCVPDSANCNLGSDLALIGLVQDALNNAGWRSHIDTGRLAFPLGNHGRNVNDRVIERDGHAPVADPPADPVASDIAAPPDEL